MKLGQVYPGWSVLAGSFVCAALAIGFTSYIYGMFTLPVTEDLGISRSTFNNGMIGLIIGGAIASPVIGKLLDHFPVRWIMVGCALAFGGTLMTVSRIDSPWLMLLMITTLLPFSTAGCGVLGANTVVVRWFKKRRGRALGVLSLSTSVGGFIAQPLTAFLIETVGWRDALFLIGLGPMVIFLLMAAFVVRDRPTEHTPGGEQEFGRSSAVAGVEDESETDFSAAEKLWTARDIIRSRNFWLVSLGIGLLFGIDQAVLLSQVPFFQDAGYELQLVSVLVAVKAISAVGGKLIVGYLADKVDLRVVFACVAGCNALLLSVYIIQPSLWFLFASVTLLGIAVGGVFPAWSTILAWLFGARSYGTVMGLMAVIMQPFAMVAMRFIGQVYDQTGTYIPAFTTFIVLDVVAMMLIFMVRPDPVDDSGQSIQSEQDVQGRSPV
ncbi:MFS transporter [Aestuariicella hydrocarbonica]|uniref:MFS transporter n=1 Tax=Pseudomaricurvus hydrocarbonicus TaxID=1470433 RepID=A0A9E5MHF3_9GAMM|nr:MFS transporter [Aestuariicella hydrocarbonica]NHO65871.1 MFS transporter [Aestuariicella hydrocarbonica]